MYVHVHRTELALALHVKAIIDMWTKTTQYFIMLLSKVTMHSCNTATQDSLTTGGLVAFFRPSSLAFFPPLLPRPFLCPLLSAVLACLLLPSENSTRVGFHFTPFFTDAGELDDFVLLELSFLSGTELSSSLESGLQNCLKMSAGLLKTGLASPSCSMSSY